MIVQINSMPDFVYIHPHTFSIPGLFKKTRTKDNLIKILKDTFPFIKKATIFSSIPSIPVKLARADIVFSIPTLLLVNYINEGLNPILLYRSFDDSTFSETEWK